LKKNYSARKREPSKILLATEAVNQTHLPLALNRVLSFMLDNFVARGAIFFAVSVYPWRD
jgi:hypothetical protein